MKLIIFLHVILYLFTSFPLLGISPQKEGTSNNRLKEILLKAPAVDISKVTFDFDAVSEDENTLVDSLSFISIYQADSLINKDEYYFESPVYIFGKVHEENYDVLITVRYYGVWFKTLDMLTYDKNGTLKGFFCLAGYGGDTNYSYRRSGYFDENMYVAIEEEADVEGEFTRLAKYVNCTRAIRKYLIHDNGEVSLIEMMSEEIDCPKLNTSS
jgi:hypothetical protein